MSTRMPWMRARSCADGPGTNSRVDTTCRWMGAMAAMLLASLAGACSYVERARQAADVGVDLAQHFQVEGLVQADVERQRLRAARCLSPLLTPATLSAAATDQRLGSRWIDELLRDCPQFAAFLSELTLRRARQSGLLPMAKPAVPAGAGSSTSETSSAAPDPTS